MSRDVDVVVTRESGGVEVCERIRELIFRLKSEGVADADN